MFEILHIIGKNVTEKPETIRLPYRPPPPAGFRGLVLLDPQRCIGCGLCAYVCVSESVTGATMKPSTTGTTSQGVARFARVASIVALQTPSETQLTHRQFTRAKVN
jgi:formate hydrogenlyase subunit 6/NADH:ubiquinone oxidoreductase subunit I